jgi:site-specific DNA-methyltransferase (adenine-specific)
MAVCLRACHGALMDGGRIAVNVAVGYNRSPWIPLGADWTKLIQDTGYLLRGEIAWDKGPNGLTVWGSWLSASNPAIRDSHEVILLGSKGRLDRGHAGETTISPLEFLAWTQSIWRMQPASATRIGHPAPFPVQLPWRCIKLLSYQEDIICDPFMGSGTTLVAAKRLGRKAIGVECVDAYIDIAIQRLQQDVLL